MPSRNQVPQRLLGMRRALLLVITTQPLVFLAVAGPSLAWTRYGSERYGTSIEAPDGWIAQRAPDDGDGRELASPDRRATIVVFAEQDVLGQGLVPSRDMRLTYKARGQGWAVYSGTLGDQIFYERMFSACSDHRLIHHLVIAYRAEDRARMAPLVKHVAGSLRGGCAE